MSFDFLNDFQDIIHKDAMKNLTSQCSCMHSSIKKIFWYEFLTLHSLFFCCFSLFYSLRYNFSFFSCFSYVVTHFFQISFNMFSHLKCVRWLVLAIFLSVTTDCLSLSRSIAWHYSEAFKWCWIVIPVPVCYCYFCSIHWCLIFHPFFFYILFTIWLWHHLAAVCISVSACF